MAARCQAAYSSTPASSIYAQSWPVPSHSLDGRNSSKPRSNSPRKSLNSPWICKAKKHSAKPQRANGPVKKTNSWAVSMLNSNYPEWVNEDGQVELDMAKEFRLTLQMFKNLTQQLKEVDEKLNSHRKPFAFKNCLSDKDTPGIYRSQLAANMRSYTAEVPVTNQAQEPINNFGSKREMQRPHSHLGVSRKTDKPVYNMIPKPKADAWSSSSPKVMNKTKAIQAEEKKASAEQNYQQTLKKENFNTQDNNNLLQISSPDLSSDETVGFGYIDPVPDDWDKRKLEELEQEFASNEQSKVDPFMVRYLQLRRLETDTLENERRNPKIEENVENFNGLNCSSVKTNGNIHGKKACSKVKQSTDRSSEKNCGKKSSHSFSPSLCYSSTSLFKSDIDVRKNTGCQSCISNPGSCILEEKLADSKQKKQSLCTKRSKCSSARGRRKVCSSSNGKVVYSANLCQSHYGAGYDIVELASSFVPPCKDRIKMKSKPVTAKSAKSKGLLPGKSWFSQRRFSLTSDQVLLPMTSDAGLPSNKSRTSKSRQKSAKRGTRRCASSKL